MNSSKVIHFVKKLLYQKDSLCLLPDKRVFPCLVLSRRHRGGYTAYNTVKAKEEALEKIHKADNFGRNKAAGNVPISLKYLNNMNQTNDHEEEENNSNKMIEEQIPVQFPFQHVHKLGKVDYKSDSSIDSYELMRLRNNFFKEKNNWMLNYENFEDTSLHSEEYRTNHDINYGTPDPKCKISSVPCGGCGACLHCKDPSLPGYIPSEIFKNSRELGGADLTALICQRCYFLKNHNVALEVQVSDSDYPEVLKNISARKGVVILMVDLTDFPCSIWPGIADIFHKMPILVVGNKVDLLPKDSPNYLNQIKRKLKDSIKAYGFASHLLIDIILISATTGYGVEDMIIKLQQSWRHKGNVYLVGCTNVGKSSLFNTLIQSDFCKSQAEDFVQRATTSVWPGTTLNLLKFPVSKPGGYKLELRLKRLKQLKKLERFEAQEREQLLKETNDWRHAVLMGRIDRSSSKNTEPDHQDVFSIRPSNNATGITTLGLNENDPLYAHSRWCYDTPGVVQPDQILNLLTTEELFLTLPKTLIFPRTYCIRPGDSLFIGGLARLDFLEGRDSIWFTVFASAELPISICLTEEADEFYKEHLGTKYLKVPFGGSERLKKWPGLSNAKTFTVEAIDFDYSSKDVVLSNAGHEFSVPVTKRSMYQEDIANKAQVEIGNSRHSCFASNDVTLASIGVITGYEYSLWLLTCASFDVYLLGWISITGRRGRTMKLRAWTPEKRGVHLRDCLLPQAVNFKGTRISSTPAYKKHRYFAEEQLWY